MARSAFLMFILFLVTAVFYNAVVNQNMPGIQSKQKILTEMLDNLDERALSQVQSGH